RADPFDGRPPRWVRARLFLYRFSTREEKRRTGDWWVREFVQTAVRPVRLEDFGESPQRVEPGTGRT
ncbi:MAG TPA: lipase maturation factor family protein, partial [Naasia sp.]